MQYIRRKGKGQECAWWHFTTDGFAAAMLLEFAKITKAGPGLHKEVVEMAQQTLAFLDKQWASRRPVS